MQISDVKLGNATRLPVDRAQCPVQVIAVIGTEHGMDQSNIAINLAQSLASAGNRTMLLDADPGSGNIEILLGVMPQSTLFDVVTGCCQLEETIHTVADGLLLLSAAVGKQQLAQMNRRECAGLVRVFSDLDTPLDTLIINTASGLSDCAASFCRAATEVLVVVNDDSESVKGSIAHIDMLCDMYGIHRFRILANNVNSAFEGRAVFEKILGNYSNDHDKVLLYSGFISCGEYLSRASGNRNAVVTEFPDSHQAIAIVNLARRVMLWPHPGIAGGHLEFFVERLFKNENRAVEAKS